MTKQQRTVLIVCILASFVAFLDGSAVNVALPAIAHELGGGFVIQQWTVDAYLITLGALILVAGSFSDIFGRKRVLYAGLIGFMITSLLCAAAPGGVFLVIARALQGAAGALLVPSSLALIIASFNGPAEGKAIGTWTAWGATANIIGPLLGGILVDVASWRLVFAINVLPIIVTLYLMRKITHDKQPAKDVYIDTKGAVLCVVALGGTVYGLIEQARLGWGSPLVYVPFVAGLISLAVFVWHEYHTTAPMLPLGLFKVRNFSVGNVSTFAIYGGLSVAVFLIAVFVQQVAGYTALEAGLALLPVTIIMFFLSSPVGALAGRYGPRFFMGVGPIIGGVSFLYLMRADATAAYVTQLLPAIVGFGVGLVLTVAPLTAAILGAVEPQRAGIASAVNNAVARIAGLITVAVLGMVTGSHLDAHAFHRGMVFAAALLIGGGVISAIGIQNNITSHTKQ